MKKYLLVLVLNFFLCFTVVAQDNPETQEETNAFGYPDKSFVTVINNEFTKNSVAVNDKPQCNDVRLLSQAKEVVKNYINLNARTITDKRRNKLILKNVDNFNDLHLNNINSRENRPAAARIVELKINTGLGDNNIKVCHSDNPFLDARLYLIMYDVRNEVVVEIINFRKDIVPSFIWKQE